MSLQIIPGTGIVVPGYDELAGTDFFNTARIDAATEKIAYIGRYWNKDRASKDITKIGFLTGTVTDSAPVSTCRVSLQDVSASAGAPGQPDGTQDQYVDIGLAALTSNAWHQSAALSANRTISPGDLLAVVFEFSTFNAGAVFDAKGAYLGPTMNSPLTVLYTGSWAAQYVLPDVIFEHTDGTFGTLAGARVLTAMSTQSFNSGSAPDEYGMVFSYPFPCTVDALLARWGFGASAATGSLVLYDGTTALATVTLNARTQHSGSVYLGEYPLASPVDLSANTTYRLALQATSATDLYLAYTDYNAAGHGQCRAGGDTWGWCSRTNAGAWSGTTLTRRPWMGMRISRCDGGGGAMVLNRRRKVR